MSYKASFLCALCILALGPAPADAEVNENSQFASTQQLMRDFLRNLRSTRLFANPELN